MTVQHSMPMVPSERNTQAKIEETGMREERHAKRWREVKRGGRRENKRGGWETEYKGKGCNREIRMGKGRRQKWESK